MLIYSARKEYEVYRNLLRIVPGLEERIATGSDEEVMHVSDMVSTIFQRIFMSTDLATYVLDPERSLWCTRRRYKKP
jgi:hypothetical protein